MNTARAEVIPIRPAEAADVPAILGMIARIYADYGDVLDVDREDPHLRQPLEYFRAGGGELWVADANGIVAGATGVRVADGAAEIKTVYVAHEFRRRGLARRMTHAAIARARECLGPAAPVALWSDTRFTEAHALYESLGFVRCGRRDLSVVNTFSEFRYELPMREQPRPERR